MKIIAGLGNPGKQYATTRHNAGFLALDAFVSSKDVEELSLSMKFDSVVREIRYSGKKALLLYPQTYMNDSGRAVKAAIDFYKLSPADLIVVHDEVDLPLGTVKVATDSGAAGHNGVKSVIDALATQEFARIRIGVETRQSREHIPTDAFVLQKFSETELKEIPFDIISEKIASML